MRITTSTIWGNCSASRLSVRCKLRARRVITAPRIIDDIPEHYSSTLGTTVRGRSHRCG